MAKRMFVATTETQGQRENDFCYVPEGEIVIFPLITCTGEEPDDECGCRRAMTGTRTMTATTTVKVAEIPGTANLAGVIERSWERGSWTKYMGDSEDEVFAAAMKEARRLIGLAQEFPVGTIVEIRGDELVAR